MSRAVWLGGGVGARSGYTLGMNMRLRKLVRRFPWLRGAAKGVYRSGQYFSARVIGRLRQDPLRPLCVDPGAITFTIAVNDPALTGNGLGHIGTVAEGDWDLNGVPVQAHDGVYAILRGRVEDGRDWRDIPEYRANVARIAEGEIVDSAATEEEYAARWAAIVALYERIAQAGYQSQAELGKDNVLDEVRIQIGRRGELLFEEGLHRLAIAQLLALPEIPVLVTRRHRQWADLREAVLKIVGQRGFFHQPFGHPDLDCLNDWYGSKLVETAVYGDERWEFIRSAEFVVQNREWGVQTAGGSEPASETPNRDSTMLDIGAYFGYFCQRFEELGFACTAVEPDGLNVAVLRRWRAMRGKQFAVREMSIFDLPETDFDVVLALNIFHHFMRTEAETAQLVAFLERLSCRAMFFEPDSNAGVEALHHFSDEEFVDFVLAHAGLSKARLLGRAREGRNVYLLT